MLINEGVEPKHGSSSFYHSKDKFLINGSCVIVNTQNTPNERNPQQMNKIRRKSDKINMRTGARVPHLEVGSNFHVYLDSS